MSIYTTQTDLTFRVTTGKDVTGCDCFLIFTSPSNIVAQQNAAIVNAATGVIEYSLTAPLVTAGRWSIRAKVVNSQGLISIGDLDYFTLKAQ